MDTLLIANLNLPPLVFPLQVQSLCANGLLVDFANHHLIDAVSFATFLCQTGGFGPLMHASFFALANDC